METNEEKFAKGVAYKDEGNQHFKEGEWQKAIASYHHAGLYLAGLGNENRGIADILSGKVSEPINDGAGAHMVLPESQKQLSIVRSNMAACFLKLEKYSRAIECANQCLQIDPTNLKAAYRKLQALRLSKDIKYKSFLDSLIAQHPQEETLRKELEEWNAENKKKTAEADKKMAGFLNRASAKKPAGTTTATTAAGSSSASGSGSRNPGASSTTNGGLRSAPSASGSQTRPGSSAPGTGAARPPPTTRE
ncbi:hypothetical protein V8E36_005582 [Tilletia maclaganii]